MQTRRTAHALLVGLLATFAPMAVAQTPVPRTMPKPAARAEQPRVRKAPKPARPHLPGVRSGGPRLGTAEGDVELRREWFLRQRTYPSGTIPPDARRRALLSFRGRSVAKGPSPAWSPLGPTGTQSAFLDNWGLTSGRINAIAVSPADTRLILVGGATGGIWRSVDGGATFAPTSDDQVDLAVGSIAFAPSDPATVYAGMGDKGNFYLGTGVLKSTDGGQTWARVSDGSLPPLGLIARLAVDPTDPNRVYVAQYAALADGQIQSSGFFRSTDGGVSWTRTLAGLPRDVVVAPSNPQVLYLGMARVDQDGLSAGVYKSTDAGATWARSFASPYEGTFDARLAVTPAAPDTVYFLTGGIAGGSFDVRVAVTANSGASWTVRQTSGVDRGQFGYNSVIAVDPANADVVLVGTRDIYRSGDGARTWAPVTDNFDPDSGAYHPDRSRSHPDQHAIAFATDGSGAIYIGNDGGISKSTDGGATFSSLNATLSLTQFTSLAVHPTDSRITYGGTQDNGTERRLSGTAWQEFISGDGGNCVIDPIDPSIVYTTYVLTFVFRFSDDGETFEDVIGNDEAFDEPRGSPRVAFYPPFTGNGVDSRLYFGTWRLFVSTNRGASWSAPARQLDLTKGDGVLTTIGVSRANPNVIYTGANDGRAMASTDAGATWTDVTAGLPDRYITNITVAPDDPATAYLAVSGFGSGHVFKTTNGGASWTDISANLPDIPTNALLVDPLNPATLYAGTDVGVFVLPGGAAEWLVFNDGMPPAVVTAFSAQANGLIQLATYGRGVYQFGAAATPPSVSLVAPNGGSLRAGTTITIDWTTQGDAPLASHELRLSTDGGQTFPIAIATGLPGTAQSYTYAIPATMQKTRKARFLVIATDARGGQGQDSSDRNIKIKRARR